MKPPTASITDGSFRFFVHFAHHRKGNGLHGVKIGDYGNDAVEVTLFFAVVRNHNVADSAGSDGSPVPIYRSAMAGAFHLEDEQVFIADVFDPEATGDGFTERHIPGIDLTIEPFYFAGIQGIIDGLQGLSKHRLGAKQRNEKRGKCKKLFHKNLFFNASKNQAEKYAQFTFHRC